MPRNACARSSTPKNKPMSDWRHRAHDNAMMESFFATRHENGIGDLIIQEADKLFDRLGAIPFGKTEVDGVKKRIDDENDIQSPAPGRQRRNRSISRSLRLAYNWQMTAFCPGIPQPGAI